MNKHKPYFHFIILALIIFCTGCTLFPRFEKEVPPPSPTQLNVVYPEDSLLYLPFYVALDQQFFQQENLDINLQKASTQDAVAGLLNKQYDLFLGGPENVFYAYQQEQEDKLVILGQITLKTGYFLLARKSEQPCTWPDVKGKVIIGTASGEAVTIAFETVLKKHNLRPFLDVHIINNLPLTLRPGTFLGGTGQLILTTEPTTTRLEKEEAGHVIASLDEQLQVDIPTVMITTKSLLQKKQEPYQRFREALQQGLSWVNEHSPEEIATVALKFFPEQEEKTLLRGICRYKNLSCWPETPILTEKGLHSFQQLLLDTHELNSPLPLYELIEQ